MPISWYSLLTLAGRILISLIFLFSGISKLAYPEATKAYMESAGMTNAFFFLYAAGIIEILASLMIIAGWKARIGAFILFLFLIPATFLFHAYWTVSAPELKQIQMVMFLKNIAIMGGLLYIVGAGPGSYSFEPCCHHSRTNGENAEAKKKYDSKLP